MNNGGQVRKISIIAAIVLIIQFFNFIPVAVAANCNWPCFLGDNTHASIAQSGCGPRSPELNKIWEFKAKGAIHMSVVIDGDRAYFGTASNKFYCIDALKGTEIWEYEIGESCKNAKGATIGGAAATPVIYNGYVYFGTICGSVICLDAKTGYKKWIFEDSLAVSFNAPIVIQNNLLYAVSDGWLYCIDASTGKKLWFEIALKNDFSPPCISNGRLYIAAMFFMECYDAPTGKSLVSTKFWTSGEEIYSASPAVKNNKVYFGCADSDFHRFDGYTGERDWEAKYACTSSTAVTNDSVLFCDIRYNLVSLNENTGSLNWKYTLDNFIFGGPVISENTIYVGTISGTLYSFDMQGKLKSRYNFSDAITAPPSIANGFVYATSNNNTVACFGDNSQSKPTRITVEAETTNLQPGETTQCKATAFNKNNEVVDCPITWSVEPSYLGSITQDGLFTAGESSGKVTVKACSGNICGKQDITIKSLADSVSRVEIIQPTSSYLIGTDYLFSATAYDIKDAVINGVKAFWSVDPSENGFIDPQGLFTPKKEGECTIVAKIGQVIARLKIVVTKVTAIDLKPDKISIAPKTKTRFIATVFDSQGKTLQDTQLNWSIEPYYIGTIDNYGTFTAAADSAGQTGIVIVEGYGIKKTAEISIVENKKSELKIDKTMLDFGIVDPGQNPILSVSISNTGNATDSVTVSTGSGWFKVSPETKDIEPNGKIDISVELVKEQMTRNSRLEGVLSITSASGSQTSIVVKVTVSDKAPTCFETRPPEIYCGKVARGKTVTMPLQIKILSKMPVSGSIKSEQPWIDISPSTFANATGTLDIQVKISGSGLPSVNDFEGLITISSNQDCQPLSIKVVGSTDKEINIKLTLNNKLGKINDSDIELDVPPQKVKGRTLVPIRFLSEAFGCSIKWDAKEGKITIIKGSLIITLFKDRTEATVGGMSKTLDVPPTIVSGRTLVPLRFIAEAFGATVNFNSKTQEIDILWTPY